MKIFIISLLNEKKRQNYIQSQFEKKGVPIEFVFGIDGRKLNLEEINTVYDAEKAKKHYGELSRGEIGCALSHRLAYECMIKRNIERAIILEDDIRIKEDFFVIFGLLEKLPIKNYIIKMDKVYANQTVDDNSRFARFTPWHRIKLNEKYSIKQPLNDPTLTWGYYIDIKAAYTLYNLLPKIFAPSDAWYYFKRFIKLRMLNRSLINNNTDFESIIGNHIEFSNEKSLGNLRKKKTHKNTRSIINIVKKAVKLILKIFY
jgi:glycosyl transferase family 25